MDQFKLFDSIKTSFESFGAIWRKVVPLQANLEPFGIILRNLEQFESFWRQLEPFEPIKIHLEPFKAI